MELIEKDIQFRRQNLGDEIWTLRIDTKSEKKKDAIKLKKQMLEDHKLANERREQLNLEKMPHIEKFTYDIQTMRDVSKNKKIIKYLEYCKKNPRAMNYASFKEWVTEALENPRIDID